MSNVFWIAVMSVFLGAGCISTSPNVSPKPTPEPVPTPVDPHVSWQTYDDSTYGFTIQYPGDVSIDLASESVSLPEAVGEKSRTFQVMYPNPLDLDERGCLSVVGGTIAEPDFSTKEGVMFCLTTMAEGAVGSTYLTYHYITKLEKGPVDLAFTIRHVTDVRVYGGCETDADLTKPFCVERAFDEARDTALFGEIFETFALTEK